MQIVTPSRLEGDPSDIVIDDDESYIPGCPKLDREVRQLHALARSGAIPVDVAERQLNTYLLAAACQPSLAPHRLILPLTDAPQHGLLPDLGQIIHRVLARDPIPCALSAVVEQCIPCFRHATRVICYAKDSQEPLLTLVMALLLGLYPGSVKRPGFCTRVLLYEQVHRLLTAPPQRQSEFCAGHEDILILACMEYVARVLPVHMPVQSQLLTGGDSATAGFFRRIPMLCDDLRQWLDDAPPQSAGFWDSIRQACTGKVERVSRLKRCHPPHLPPRDHCDPHTIMAQEGPAGIKAYWDAPLLEDGTPDEYRLMALGFGLRGDVLQHIQRELRVYPLPDNLQAMQTKSLQRAARASGDTVYLQTFRCCQTVCEGCSPMRDEKPYRRYICMHCMLYHKSEPVAKLRLDTLTLKLTCATCLHKDLIRVNMVGRVLRFRKQHFYLCPSCVSIQEYKGESTEQIWPLEALDGSTPGCAHKPPPRQSATGRRKQPCTVCSESASGHTVERVDHLTGEMRLFHYCQRHTPRYDVAAKCVNARQLEGC